MREIVLLCVEGAQQLKQSVVYSRALREEGIRTAIFSPNSLPDSVLTREFNFQVGDLLAVPGFLKSVGLVLFFTNESSPVCLTSIMVSKIAKLTGCSVIGVQHGWIQPGLNYISGLSRTEFSGRRGDNSKAIHHFSEVIEWFGDEGIGFPFKKEEVDPVIPEHPEINLLICSNFNWGVYSNENIVGFLKSVKDLSVRLPSASLCHRPHPAEKNMNLGATIGFYSDFFKTHDAEWDSIDSALAWADIVITTPSTTVLDAICKGKPVFIYDNGAFDSVLENFKDICFSGEAELASKVYNLLSGGDYEFPSIEKFVPSRFTSRVRSEMSKTSEYNLSEDNFLDFIVQWKATR